MNKILMTVFTLLLSAVSMFAGADVEITVYDISTKRPLTGVIVGFKADEKQIEYNITDRYGKCYINIEEGSYSVYTKYFVNQDTILNYHVHKGKNILKIEIIPDVSSLYKQRTYTVKGFDVDDPLMPTAKVSRDADIISETASGAAGVELRSMALKSDGEYSTDDKKTKRGDRTTMTDMAVDGVGSTGEKFDALDPSIDREIDHGDFNPPSEQGSAGVLTSGEVNDFRKWDYWQDISTADLSEYRSTWEFTPVQRYSVQLINRSNRPVIDAKVQLVTGNDVVIWESRSDNTGKAELWSNIFNNNEQTPNNLLVKAYADGQTFAITDVKEFHDGINFIQMNVSCDVPNTLDIVWAVDATGSMGDEINYLKAELSDIIGKIQNLHKGIDINLGSVFYRDIRDEYLIQKSELTTDIDKTIEFIESQRANGGGDFPEGVEYALSSVVNEFNWSENAVARLMFLILDAPPHNDKDAVTRLKELTAKASLMGIRIIPVTCSGIDKSTEYLMRSLALATNGTYVFLTDHSGVGGSHIEPTTEKYDVELLNDLFIRLIDQFTVTNQCDDQITMETAIEENIYNHGEANPGFDDIKFMITCYPNPTDGLINIKSEGKIDELYLVDMNGKILQRPEGIDSGTIQLDLGSYPTGFYFIKYRSGTTWAGYKILLSR